MCVCVLYSEVKSEIQQQLKRAALIPILGSGFTRGCTSRKGTVPSGDDYKEYMIGQIIKTRGYDDSKRLNYEKNNFLIYLQSIMRLFQRKIKEII